MVDNSTASNSNKDMSWSSEEDSFSETGDERFKLQLIKEVRIRKKLWHPNYTYDHLSKDTLWKEVVRELDFPDRISWKNLSDTEKLEKAVEEVRKKWKNMKDCFCRYVSRRNKGEKLRRYRYYKQLKFLETTITNSSRGSTSNVSKGVNRKNCPKKSKPGKFDCKRSRSHRNLWKKTYEANTSSARGSAPSRQSSNDPATVQRSSSASTTGNADKSIRDPGVSTTDVSTTEGLPRHPGDKPTCTLSKIRGTSSSLGHNGLPAGLGDGPTCSKLAIPGTSYSLGHDGLPAGLGDGPTCSKLAIPGMSHSIVHDGLPAGSGSRSVVATYMPHAITPFESTMLELLKARHEDEMDEDRNFAFSLIPMLKELDYDKKYFAKRKILKVMKIARYRVLDGLVDLPRPVGDINSVMSYSHDGNEPFMQHSINPGNRTSGQEDVDNERSSSESDDNELISEDEQTSGLAPRK